MKANRKRDTGPELALRSALHRDGLRFRCDYPIHVRGRRPVRVDIAFPRARVVVFMDGCFWHCCPVHATIPRANRSYWEPKLLRNIRRDIETDAALAAEGWQAIRVWEHEDPCEAAQRIRHAVTRARDQLNRSKALPHAEQKSEPGARVAPQSLQVISPTDPDSALLTNGLSSAAKRASRSNTSKRAKG